MIILKKSIVQAFLRRFTRLRGIIRTCNTALTINSLIKQIIYRNKIHIIILFAHLFSRLVPIINNGLHLCHIWKVKIVGIINTNDINWQCFIVLTSQLNNLSQPFLISHSRFVEGINTKISDIILNNMHDIVTANS